MIADFHLKVIYTRCNDTNTFQIEEDQLQVVAAITIVTCSISIIASFSIIAAILYRYKCCMVSIYQLLNIVVADFIASILMMISIIMNFTEKNTTVPCQLMTVASLTVYLSSFAFLVLYAAQAYVGTIKLRKGRVYRVFEPEYRFNVFKLLYIFGWIVPITVSCITYYKFTKLPFDLLQQCFTCVPLMHFRNLNCRNVTKLYEEWIKQSVLFLVPGVLTGLLLIMFLCGHLYEYSLWYKQKTAMVIDSNKLKEEIQKKKTVVCYFVFSFVFCWLPCFLILGLGENYSVCNIYPLYVIQAFTVPLHGMMNSFVYGWQRKSIRQLLLNKPPKLNDSTDFTAQITISQNDISSMFMYSCSDDDYVVINNHHDHNSEYGSLFLNDEDAHVIISKNGGRVKGTEKLLYG